MKRVINLIIIICFFALVYIVLMENFSWINFGIGLGISLVAVIFSNRVLLSENYEKLFTIKILGFVLYLFYLMAKVMQAGFRAGILTIRGKVKLDYKHFYSTLPNDFALNLLANSITLTPGTVTIDRKDKDLYIMQLCKTSQEFDFKDIQAFEKRIKKFAISEVE